MSSDTFLVSDTPQSSGISPSIKVKNYAEIPNADFSEIEKIKTQKDEKVLLRNSTNISEREKFQGSSSSSDTKDTVHIESPHNENTKGNQSKELPKEPQKQNEQSPNIIKKEKSPKKEKRSSFSFAFLKKDKSPPTTTKADTEKMITMKESDYLKEKEFYLQRIADLEEQVKKLKNVGNSQ